MEAQAEQSVQQNLDCSAVAYLGPSVNVFSP